ncbi:MAG: hypothetical protein WCT23_01570 [Candidatus Neomarinimicrobiota bacterium]
MKKKLYYISFITLFCLTFAYSADIFKSFFQENPSDYTFEKNALYYAVDHKELLRESKNDSLVSRYTLRKQFIEYTQLFKNFSLHFDYSRNILNFSDILNNYYTASDPLPISYSFGIKTGVLHSGMNIQPGFNFSFSTLQDTLFIKNFPRSETKIYNDYFFDLLPGTLGDTIYYGDNYYKLDLDLLLDKIEEERGFSFYTRFTSSRNLFSEEHINTGKSKKLQGPRASLNSLGSRKYLGQFSLKLNRTSLLKFTIDLSSSPLDWSHTVFPHDPDTLEIIRLVNSKLNSYSCRLGYELLDKPIKFDISLYTGGLYLNSHIATPVLGYLFSLLPIAHQGDIDLSTQYFHFISHFDYPIDLGFMNITPSLDMLNGLYSTRLDILALLQFGIEDIDMSEEYLHFASISSLGINSKFILSPDLYMDLNISQLIPVIKQLSPEALTPEPSELKRYGGLSISLGVGMSW